MPHPLSLDSPEARAAFLSTVRAGGFITTACEAAEIAPSTYYRWKARHAAGDQRSRKLAGFFAEVERAEAAVEAEALRPIARGAKGWQASAWFLERRFPRRWGRAIHRR